MRHFCFFFVFFVASLLNDVRLVQEREAELRTVISKLIKAEEATEGAFTCLACMNIYRKPVTCIPCGHSFCIGCIQTAGHCTV